MCCDGCPVLTPLPRIKIGHLDDQHQLAWTATDLGYRWCQSRPLMSPQMRLSLVQDGILRLSPVILTVLQGWSKEPGTGPEERELAGQLFTDFNR